ncbi:MAG: GAF domain-containing protein [Bdellovibrionaceae bacterium]|nr:GAF domain-containing protein [Pseudobdellovibrionaceae bacterium]
MDESLKTYITERLSALKTPGKLEWISSNEKASQADTPVSFAGKELAYLRSESPFSDEESASIKALAAQLGALIATGNPDAAIRLDRIIEDLHDANPHYDWTGIYVLKGERLQLSVFRGSPSPHEIIPFAQGICGAAVQENQTLNIPDVAADPRYLSCDFRTRSEIVVPIRDASGKAIGEIDIDSHLTAAFTERDARQLEELALELAPVVVDLI